LKAKSLTGFVKSQTPNQVALELKLVGKNLTSRRQLEAEGGLRAIRAAMVAYPNMAFAGFFKELQPWLKSQPDHLEAYMLTAQEHDAPPSPPTPKLPVGPDMTGPSPLDDDCVSSVSSSFSSLESFVPSPAHKAERRVVVPDGSGFGYMGERHPIELVSWLMANPMVMFKARKSNGLALHSLKRTYMWLSRDGSQLHYSYKVHPSCIITHHASCVVHPSYIVHCASCVAHPSCIVHDDACVVHPSCIVHCASCVAHPSCIVHDDACVVHPSCTMHRGQAAEEGALPRALRSVATVAVAGLRVGHVTQRLQQQAPRGSEPRCLTLVMRDATCLSVVFADEGAMRRCRAATGLAALAAHAAGERERERKREGEREREREKGRER
jgi:hypothetical protein